MTCSPSFLNKRADERSRGQVSAWVRSWWQTKKGLDFGGFALKAITKDNMFKLRDLQGARLWMMPSAAMEAAMELMCKDHLAHPQWPHVFVVPCLMMHFWRKDLMKSAELHFTVPVEVPFWAPSQFKPLIFAIVLPLSHVARHTGPWLVKRTPEGEKLNRPSSMVSRGETPMTQSHLMSWKGSCVVCGKIRKGGHGLLCSNFLLGQATVPPCRNVWCGGCYWEASNDRFTRLDNTGEAANTSNLEIEVSPTLGRYRSARDGNHLMGVPFECDLCSF